MEIPYIFGLPFIKDNPTVRAESQIEDILPWDKSDQEWSDYMMDLWTNFAKYRYYI